MSNPNSLLYNVRLEWLKHHLSCLTNLKISLSTKGLMRMSNLRKWAQVLISMTRARRLLKVVFRKLNN